VIDLNGNDTQEGIETVLAVLVVISVVISAIFVIIKGIRAVNGIVAVFVNFFHDWNGTPARPDDGVEAIHGVLGRLSESEAARARIEATVDSISARVEHELTADHGTSMKDVVVQAQVASEQALNAVFILKKQHQEWQDQYRADQDMNRSEWVVVLEGVSRMIPMDPSEQGPFWEKIVTGYATKTLVESEAPNHHNP
jgi:hypothetical protein